VCILFRISEIYFRICRTLKSSHFSLNPKDKGVHGGVVVKALCYKPAGRGFDSRCCHWKFSLAKSFRYHYGPGFDSDSNRNEYQVFFLGVKAVGA
jgi:hypothetical protein